MRSSRFVKGTERLVDPIAVGSIHFLQGFMGMLPRGVQNRVLERSSKRAPYMGFVVEPYATFLFYEIADEQAAAALLPEGFRLARSRPFAGGDEGHFAIVSLFRAHTSAFWGARAEFYLVAEDERTGLLSWVIVDYLSDTISHDRAGGLRAPTAPGSVVTTSADGHVVVDVRDTRGERAVAIDAALAGARMRGLDQRLWVEGNLSVAYGPELSPGDAGVFALTFDASEMSEALDVALADVRVERMTWFSELVAANPAHVVCFPFAQHLLSDSPGVASGYASAEELERAVREVDFESIPRFSAASTRRAMVVGTAASLLAIAGLAVALAIT